MRTGTWVYSKITSLAPTGIFAFSYCLTSHSTTRVKLEVQNRPCLHPFRDKKNFFELEIYLKMWIIFVDIYRRYRIYDELFYKRFLVKTYFPDLFSAISFAFWCKIVVKVDYFIRRFPKIPSTLRYAISNNWSIV